MYNRYRRRKQKSKKKCLNTNKHYSRRKHMHKQKCYNTYKNNKLRKNIKGGNKTIKMKSKEEQDISLNKILRSGNKKNPQLKFKVVEYDKEKNKVKVSLNFKFPKNTFLSLKSKNVNTTKNTLQKLIDTYFKDRKKNKDFLTAIANTFVNTTKATTSMITGDSASKHTDKHDDKHAGKSADKHAGKSAGK